MVNTNKELTSLDTRLWENVVESLESRLKCVVKSALKELLDEKMCTANIADKRLNTEELCARWNISKGTLLNWEKDGRIAPLPLGGRRKIYSMRDVLTAESEGLIKTAC